VTGFDARAWLDSHVNLETGIGVPAQRERGAPTLERISMLLRYLGSPELEFPAIHLTGTNGKTTTARIVTELLLSLGMRVGSYTSPHLERVNERISVDGEPIDDDTLDELLRAVSLVEQAVDVQPSYFEVLTAAAFRHFDDVAVDVSVVEVGLGGTWDATNVVDAAVAVVTNVSVDHVEYLGPTREQIASEKAGIVKPGATLVLGETDSDLGGIFEARHPARLWRRDADFGVRANTLAIGGRVVDLYTPDAAYSDVFLPLHGAHQADNAAAALAATEAFVGGVVDADVVTTALARVQSPGRLEIVGRQPLVILDGAHNVAGAQALRTALDEEFAGAPRTVVVGLLREKEPHEMLTALGIDDAALVVCCRPPSPRGLDPQLVAKAAAELGVPADRIEVVDSVAEAVGTAQLSTLPEGQIVITGSLYVVGAARGLLVR
jgi:dihydrofolate synthase / folylpolyglutamate synthase